MCFDVRYYVQRSNEDGVLCAVVLLSDVRFVSSLAKVYELSSKRDENMVIKLCIKEV